MTKMLGPMTHECPYNRDCCSHTRGKSGKKTRRRMKRRERQSWKKEIR